MTQKHFQASVGSLFAIGLLGLITPAAFAQQSVDVLSEPSVGGGTEYLPPAGGATINPAGPQGGPLMRATSPSAADLNTSVQYETWSGGGKRVVSGDRQTLLMNYTRGLSGDKEVSATLPIMKLRGFAGFGTTTSSTSGIGDLEVDVRKYIYDHNNANSVTWVPNLKVFLPTTNDKDHGLALGEFGIGPSLTVSKPFGGRTLAYAGAGYTFMSGSSAGPRNKDIFQQWLGGLTAFGAKTSLQYELVHFNSITNEKFTRVLVGPRYNLSPTRTIQFNVEKELKADGKSTTISLGYSTRF